MVSTDNSVDRVESADQVTLSVSVPAGDGDGQAKNIEVPVSSLEVTKNVEVNQIRENSLKANGYSITSIEYEGSLSFMGNTVRGPQGDTFSLDSLLFDNNDVPKPATVTITHELSGKSDELTQVLATSKSYESQSEETTETSVDFVAMDGTL